MELANSINPWLQFTGVSARDSPTHTVPMLDTQLYVQHLPSGEAVRFKYFEKACTSPQVIMYDSAMPARVKFQTLANEAIRRMRNSDRDLSPAQRAAILTHLSGKMARSGYPATTRKQVIQAGLQGYYRLVKLQRVGSRRVNRTRDTASDAARLIKRALAPSTWFREPHQDPVHLEGAPALPRHAPPSALAPRGAGRAQGEEQAPHHPAPAHPRWLHHWGPNPRYHPLHPLHS